MNKFLLGCGVAALICGLSSCGGSSKTSGELANLEDSLAFYMGYSQGGLAAQQMKQMMSAEEQEKFNKDEFLKGFKQMLKTDTNDVAYLQGIAQGWQFAQQLNYFEQQGIEVNRQEVYRQFAKAFTTDSVNYTATQMAVGTFQQLMMKAQEQMRARQEENKRSQRQSVAAENEAKGAEFVKEAIAADPEIKTTESGLSYKVIKQGEGPCVTENTTAKVHYTGKLIDGTTFDSSVERGEPVDFELSRVIPGFAEGLKMMNKGSEYVLYIPASLAYGDNEAGSIPPGSTLVFTLEVVDILPTK